MRTDLGRVPGVVDIHDLHVWTVTSGMECATAHLSVEAGSDPSAVLTAARTALADHGIAHATVQLETIGAPGACDDVTW